MTEPGKNAYLVDLYNSASQRADWFNMINTNAFDYINVLDRAADACWIRNEAIGNNISNADTPGYKRQDVDFESVLKKELGRGSSKTMDSRVGNLMTNRLNPVPYTDYEGFSYRLDGNNVDPETENVMLAENQLKYQGIRDSITAEFQNLSAVMR